MATVDLQEAAALMKTSASTVEEFINSGAIPAGKLGRKWVMLKKDVLDFIERQIVTQTAARMRRPTTFDSRGRARATTNKGCQGANTQI